MIREAWKSDITALSRLAEETYADAFGHSFSAADLAAHLAKNLSPGEFARMLNDDTILVVEEGNRLIGYAQFGEAKVDGAGQTAGELRRLYVHRAFQNNGYGSLLMEAALRHPRLAGADTVYLDVWERNHGARRFYERCGFETVGARSFEVQSGAETSLDLIMVRRARGGR